MKPKEQVEIAVYHTCNLKKANMLDFTELMSQMKIVYVEYRTGLIKLKPVWFAVLGGFVPD